MMDSNSRCEHGSTPANCYACWHKENLQLKAAYNSVATGLESLRAENAALKAEVDRLRESYDFMKKENFLVHEAIGDSCWTLTTDKVATKITDLLEGISDILAIIGIEDSDLKSDTYGAVLKRASKLLEGKP